MADTVQPPRGMRDFLPDDKIHRESVLATIREAFFRYGYREIETPAVEELHRLEHSEGGDNEKLIFRILKRGLGADVPVKPADAADLGLRFDLTVPLARFYATHRAELPEVFRSIQIAPVWRAERPQRGRYRQFTQCDIDVLGEPGPVAEVELIAATADALDRLGIEGAVIRLNDRAVLNALLDACGFTPDEQPAALVSIDKLDKIGLDGVAAELAAGGAAAEALDRLVAALVGVADADGDLDRTLSALPVPVPDRASRLLAVRDGVAVAKPELSVVVDPALVRGQGYYTGPIFEVHHPAFPGGSIGGGGRYDGMIGRLAGVEVPACGFSLGFERVVELTDRERFRSARRQVALVHADDVAPGTLVAWQRRLIAVGADVRLVPRRRNLGRILDQLRREGFGEWAELDSSTPAPSTPGPAGLDLRDLR